MRVAAPADKRFRRAHVRPPRRRHSWTRVLALVRNGVAVALLAAGGYLLEQQVAHASALHVDHIAVRGNDRLSTGEVLVLLDGLRGQHLLSVDLDRWQRRLLSSPWVGHASLRRVLPSTVEVLLRERQPMAIGRLGADLYLDRRGRSRDRRLRAELRAVRPPDHRRSRRFARPDRHGGRRGSRRPRQPAPRLGRPAAGAAAPPVANRRVEYARRGGAARRRFGARAPRRRPVPRTPAVVRGSLGCAARTRDGHRVRRRQVRQPDLREAGGGGAG